jgi:hypothetical protein
MLRRSALRLGTQKLGLAPATVAALEEWTMSTRIGNLVAIVLASAACAPGVGTGRDANPEPAGKEVRVNVTNLYNGPITIYAVGGGTSYRMGTVLPGLASQFTVRPLMIGTGTVEFVAQGGTGDQPVRSGPMLVTAGKTVDFRIGAHLLNSSATIRP